jgi:hypothetical protein
MWTQRLEENSFDCARDRNLVVQSVVRQCDDRATLGTSFDSYCILIMTLVLFVV